MGRYDISDDALDRYYAKGSTYPNPYDDDPDYNYSLRDDEYYDNEDWEYDHWKDTQLEEEAERYYDER